MEIDFKFTTDRNPNKLNIEKYMFNVSKIQIDRTSRKDKSAEIKFLHF